MQSSTAPWGWYELAAMSSVANWMIVWVSKHHWKVRGSKQFESSMTDTFVKVWGGSIKFVQWSSLNDWSVYYPVLFPPYTLVWHELSELQPEKDWRSYLQTSVSVVSPPEHLPDTGWSCEAGRLWNCASAQQVVRAHCRQCSCPWI